MRIPAAKIHFPAEDRQEILAKMDQALASGQVTLGKYSKEIERRS